MSLYETCATCKGQGSLPCDQCKCPTCKAMGKMDVKCSICQSGKVKCRRCDGSGKLLEKKGFFSDKFKTCYSCGGTGKTDCETCHGTTSMKSTCSSCQGTGRNARCSTCGGKAKVTCADCKGAGRFEGQWVKSLESWPVDRLRFEFEKRQREISNLHAKISNAESELRSSNESYEEAYACRQPDFDASGYNRYNTGLMNEIDSSADRIKGLQAEMNAIERVLDKKWN